MKRKLLDNRRKVEAKTKKKRTYLLSAIVRNTTKYYYPLNETKKGPAC